MRDVVIGVDASTTAVKAIAFTAVGTALHESRHAYPLSTPGHGRVEQDPEDWWRALCAALKDLSQIVDPSRVAGIALTHQRESFCLIDRHEKAVRPAILWLDERSRVEVSELSKEFGRERIRQWTGKPPDPTPALYALAWLRKHEPKALEAAVSIVDTGTYLHLKLTGALRASLASADPLGLVDIGTRKWCSPLVAAAGLNDGQLPSLVVPSAEIGRITREAAGMCGVEAGIPVYAAVGDGQANSLGLGVIDEGSACLSFGSGVVFGMYSSTFVHSDAHRTLIAPDGTGYLVEGVLRSGMQLVDWTLRTMGSASVPDLERQALKVPPGSDRLMVLPYFSGVMNPWWDETARGAMVGLSLDDTPAHIFRAVIEGICFEQAIATEAMERSLGVRAGSIAASGGGTQSRLLMQCLCTIMNRPLAISPVKEAAALGAAMLAAKGAGWFETTGQAASSMCMKPSSVVEPVPELVAAYQPALEVYRGFYETLRPLQGALADLG